MVNELEKAKIKVAAWAAYQNSFLVSKAGNTAVMQLLANCQL
jgi:hypothetical protein